MHFQLQVVCTDEAGRQTTHPLTSLTRDAAQLLPSTFGLSLAEGKSLLQQLQTVITQQQTTAYLATQRRCRDCGNARRSKGNHQILYRTVFGALRLVSPRWHHCPCQQRTGKTYSPLAFVLEERTAPELLYLQTKWASLVSYGQTVQLLQEVLPLSDTLNDESIRQQLHRLAERGEQALGEEYQVMEGCPSIWEELPIPNGPLMVGIDGGYVKARHKQGCFEVITGKSVLSFRRDEEASQPSAKCFGLVQGFDRKPRRRLFTLMESQGMQANQQVVFLSDGADSARNLQLYLHPNAEYVLDWFHITMRLTVLSQTAKGLPQSRIYLEDVEHDLESIKHYLWHGNRFEAHQHLNDLVEELEEAEADFPADTVVGKLLKGVREFGTYIKNNQNFLVDYGERYRNGETISTAFVESTVNWVISKRMVKKQSMQWTPRGAHLLLQTRTQVLNDELEATFRSWYPQFRPIAEKTA